MTTKTLSADDVLIADELVKRFRTRENGRTYDIPAVNGISLRVARGQCLGIVGESGCGKTTTGRMMAGLDLPTSGSVLLEGDRLVRQNGRVATGARRRVQMIFQDPQSSLDSRMTAAQSVAEPLQVSGVRRREMVRMVAELLERVGLDEEIGKRRPAALSGGQRQRVGIARALALDPSLIVADEPTSALDVSVRAQVVNLLKDLQAERNLGMVFISHDLATVRYLCDEVAVMYLGRVVERGATHQVFSNPRHPYTKALLDAVPHADPRAEAQRKRIVLHGDPPDPANPPSGCAFRTRCPLAEDRCAEAVPALDLVESGHVLACYVNGDSPPRTHDPINGAGSEVMASGRAA